VEQVVLEQEGLAVDIHDARVMASVVADRILEHDGCEA
jgi:hypothetical protein